MAASRDLKVGLFVLFGLITSVLVIFLLGDERRLFSRSVPFTTKFGDVAGLKPGAPVRMGGIDIGHVERVGYDPKAPDDTSVFVTFRIVESELKRVKTDSRARVATKGLLGDKMVEITLGKEGDSIEPGGEIQSEVAADMFGKVNDVAGKAETLMDNLNRVTEPLGNEKLHRDLQGSVASVNTILKEVAEGDGYPHRFLTDPAEAERISRVLDSLERTSAELQYTLQKTRTVIARVESGPGFAHDLIYGEGPKGLAEVAGAANEVALTLKGIRESDSLVHDAMYGGDGDGAEALANVTAMTKDLRAIVADMRAGKGTVGALLVDPSVYEDVKVVLGNVQRNDVLRSLVRYSINRDEARPTVEVRASDARPDVPAPSSPK